MSDVTKRSEYDAVVIGAPLTGPGPLDEDVDHAVEQHRVASGGEGR